MLKFVGMWARDALSRFNGRASDVAAALDISVSAVSQWGDVVPYHSAMQLHLNHGVPLHPEHYGKGGRIVAESREAPAA